MGNSPDEVIELEQVISQTQLPLSSPPESTNWGPGEGGPAAAYR